MPYAYTNVVSQYPILGGIEITDEQFSQAVDAVTEGRTIVVVDGQLELPWPEPEVQHDQSQ